MTTGLSSFGASASAVTARYTRMSEYRASTAGSRMTTREVHFRGRRCMTRQISRRTISETFDASFLPGSLSGTFEDPTCFDFPYRRRGWKRRPACSRSSQQDPLEDAQECLEKCTQALDELPHKAQQRTTISVELPVAPSGKHMAEELTTTPLQLSSRAMMDTMADAFSGLTADQRVSTKNDENQEGEDASTRVSSVCSASTDSSCASDRFAADQIPIQIEAIDGARLEQSTSDDRTAVAIEDRKKSLTKFHPPISTVTYGVAAGEHSARNETASGGMEIADSDGTLRFHRETIDLPRPERNGSSVGENEKSTSPTKRRSTALKGMSSRSFPQDLDHDAKTVLERDMPSALSTTSHPSTSISHQVAGTVEVSPTVEVVSSPSWKDAQRVLNTDISIFNVNRMIQCYLEMSAMRAHTELDPTKAELTRQMGVWLATRIGRGVCQFLRGHSDRVTWNELKAIELLRRRARDMAKEIWPRKDVPLANRIYLISVLSFKVNKDLKAINMPIVLGDTSHAITTAGNASYIGLFSEDDCATLRASLDDSGISLVCTPSAIRGLNLVAMRPQNYDPIVMNNHAILLTVIQNIVPFVKTSQQEDALYQLLCLVPRILKEKMSPHHRSTTSAEAASSRTAGRPIVMPTFEAMLIDLCRTINDNKKHMARLAKITRKRADLVIYRKLIRDATNPDPSLIAAWDDLKTHLGRDYMEDPMKTGIKLTSPVELPLLEMTLNLDTKNTVMELNATLLMSLEVIRNSPNCESLDKRMATSLYDMLSNGYDGMQKPNFPIIPLEDSDMPRLS